MEGAYDKKKGDGAFGKYRDSVLAGFDQDVRTAAAALGPSGFLASGGGMIGGMVGGPLGPGFGAAAPWGDGAPATGQDAVLLPGGGGRSPAVGSPVDPWEDEAQGDGDGEDGDGRSPADDGTGGGGGSDRVGDIATRPDVPIWTIITRRYRLSAPFYTE